MHLGLHLRPVDRRRTGVGLTGQRGRVLLVLIFLADLQAVDLILVDSVQGAVCRDGDSASVHGLADFGVAGKAIEEILGVPLHVRELGEAGIEVGEIDGLGV